MENIGFVKQVYSKCFNLARDLHQGQKYGDSDYFTGHICKVIDKVWSISTFISTEDKYILQCVAALHDSLEDCCGEDSLQGHLIPQRIIDAVKKLTKEEGESLEDYISKVNSCDTARLVKIADALCNLEESLKSGEERRINKYLKTLELLDTSKEKVDD